MLHDFTDASIFSGGVKTMNFTLANWSVAASPGFARFGLPFKQGDIPAGSIPDIRLNGVALSGIQFDERSTWPDGSLRFCVAHLRDAAFVGNQARNYTIATVAGSFNNSGTKTLSDISAAHDFKVRFSTATQYDGTTSAPRGSGNLTASFNAQALIPTRVTKIHSGPVCEGWQVWGYATDNVGGAPDPHLVTVWYVDIWKNADGTIADVEYAAVPSQFWWSVAAKYRLDYDATLADGATTTQVYSSVQHPYGSQWKTVRMVNDNNSGRRHWANAIPTLFYKPDRAYWISTGMAPPLNLGVTVTKHYSPTYVPCGNMDHTFSIDAPGGSMGRGLIANSDCVAFLTQAAVDLKAARIDALAGLGVPYHYRSNRNRTRPGDGSPDTAATIISLKLDPMSSATYDFTAVGMPMPVDAYTLVATDGYVVPKGGNGVWAVAGPGGGSSSHAANYSYFMYLFEGERDLLEACLDLAMNCQHMLPGNASGSLPNLAYYSTRHAALGIPATVYHAAGELFGANVRKVGWYLNILSGACASVPDNDVQAGFIRLLNTQAGNFIAASLSYLPASQVANGCWGDINGQGEPWMISFVAQGAYANYLRTGNAQIKHLGDHCTNHLKSLSDVGMYRTQGYHTSPLFKTSEWAAGTNEYHPPATMPIADQTICVRAADRTSSPVKLTVSDTPDVPGYIYPGFSPGFLALRNGDVIRPVLSNTKIGGADYIPRGLTHGEKLYAINVGAMPSPTDNSGQTFNLSRDGVTPIDPDFVHDLAFSAALQAGDVFSCSLSDGATSLTVGPVTVSSVSGVAAALATALATYGAGSSAVNLTPEVTFRTVRWYPPSGKHMRLSSPTITRGSGPAVAVDDFMHAYFTWFPQSAADLDGSGIAVLPPYVYKADDIGTIERAGLVMAYAAGNVTVTLGDINRINAFMDTNEQHKGQVLTWQFAP